MPYMQLPPGNRSIRMHDGTRYVAPREGGRVLVGDEHVPAINALGGNGTAGLLTAGFREFTQGGRKNGRWCLACQPARLWNAWNAECPKCRAPTVPEREPAPSPEPQERNV